MAIVAQPFVKWAGGKRHLLCQLETLLPDNFDYSKKGITIKDSIVIGDSVTLTTEQMEASMFMINE